MLGVELLRQIEGPRQHGVPERLDGHLQPEHHVEGGKVEVQERAHLQRGGPTIFARVGHGDWHGPVEDVLVVGRGQVQLHGIEFVVAGCQPQVQELGPFGFEGGGEGAADHGHALVGLLLVLAFVDPGPVVAQRHAHVLRQADAVRARGHVVREVSGDSGPGGLPGEQLACVVLDADPKLLDVLPHEHACMHAKPQRHLRAAAHTCGGGWQGRSRRAPRARASSAVRRAAYLGRGDDGVRLAQPGQCVGDVLLESLALEHDEGTVAGHIKPDAHLCEVSHVLLLEHGQHLTPQLAEFARHGHQRVEGDPGGKQPPHRARGCVLSPVV